MAYIEASEVLAVFVGSASADEAKVALWIENAEVWLRAALRKRGCNLDDLADSRGEEIRVVLLNAVSRLIRNPEGYTSESEGDYSYQFAARDSSTSVWFPDSELDLICPRSRSVGTIQLGLPRGFR